MGISSHTHTITHRARGRYGALPLHVAIASAAKSAVVCAVLEAHPEAVRHSDEVSARRYTTEVTHPEAVRHSDEVSA